jgi:DNA end-binding protein Ku
MLVIFAGITRYNLNMASRAIWKGSINFGMVSIPVGLCTATSSKDLAFTELHKDQKTRIRRVRWSPELGREVQADEVIRAFEWSKGQYVEMTEEDFEKVPVPNKKVIEVVKFVEAREIDPIYYDSTYVLEPEAHGMKPYALLLHALQSKGMVALARVCIRKREELCCLRISGGNLMLETLYYADELRVELEKPMPDLGLSDQEKMMSEMLVEMMKGTFDPLEYQDHYREALMQVINAKLEGREFIEAAAEPQSQVMDLMEALRASIEQAKAKQAS